MTTRRRPPIPPGIQPLQLRTLDDVALSGAHKAGPAGSDTAFIVAHGFAGAWRQERVLRVMDRLSLHADVVAVDQRGHGGSAGRTTLGHREPLDIEAAAAWARSQGFSRVVTVGFSMGAAVVLRHGALCRESAASRGADAVVSVSGPAFWFYRGTPPMRWLHRAVHNPFGRAFLHRGLGARVDPHPWPQPAPLSPTAAAQRLHSASVPLLILHGDADAFFPLDHPQALAAAAPSATVWIEPGFGHAEGAITDTLLDRIASWGRNEPTTVG